MPQSIVLYWAGTQVLITGIMAQLQVKTPLRLSSTAVGDVVKPGVFTLIEDVVAVDGGGGEEYRIALVKRYKASAAFRRMLGHLNWFWSIGSIATAAGTTVIVFVAEDLNVVFAIGKQ